MEPLPKKSIKLLFMIVEREKGERISEFLKELGHYFSFHFYGKGTASSNVLTWLGLDDSERDIVMTPLSADCIEEVLEKLTEEFHLNEPGSGIAFSIRLTSIAGMNTLQFLTTPEEGNNG